MVPGRVFRHEQFYLDCETGLLTSRAYGRREDPPCFHGAPYPGYFLGIPGQGLALRTWVDLLDCAARADDTTRNQERAIRDELDRQRRKLS